MKLKEIDIENFRSIKNEKIVFTHDCLVLLGKNEAGKTNVLKAIASLFDEYKVSNKDRRKRLENEKIEQYFVRAVFELTPADFNIIEERFNQKYTGTEHVKFKSGISFKEFVKKVFYNFIIKIKIADGEEPTNLYWSYNKKDIELDAPLFLTGTTISLEQGPGKAFNLISNTLQIVNALYNEKPIKCHYWQYSESYLLPSSVNITDFIAKPDDFKALKNIFGLCGREEIKSEFEAAKAEDGDYSNLLEQVSKKVTTSFQKIWNDFKGTSIQLLPNGDEILIKVVGKAKYNFEDRSDGFKKFISILLMLSTESRISKILKNDLILIDEPDQSLYPTSARYLRNELIEISKKSKVVYSTHSQYMIDADCIDRHLIVEKIDDVTIIKSEHANAPFSKDELLRRAIGTSIFECLRETNIIFEGYLDKELFQLFCKQHKCEKDFSEYGNVYLGGISGAEVLAQILMLANKKFLIIADSDDTSKNKKSDFVKNYPDYKDNWLAYGDISRDVATMEDFFTVNHIKYQIAESESSYTYEEDKNAIYNIEKAVNKDKERKQQIKRQLVQSAKKPDILANYADVVQVVKDRLKSL